MQQARDLRAEETVKLARNQEDGTRIREWPSRIRSVRRRAREWTLGRGVGGGAKGRGPRTNRPADLRPREPQERKVGAIRPGRHGRAPKGSQDPRVRTAVPPRGGERRRVVVEKPRRPVRQRTRPRREREANGPLRRPRGSTTRHLDRWRDTPGPEGQVNPTGAAPALRRKPAASANPMSTRKPL